MQIVLATENPSKKEQIFALFTGSNITLVMPSEVGIVGAAVEDGRTLYENAQKKARYAHRHGTWSMADDTGIFIDALDGEPGVHTARWLSAQAHTKETMEYCLHRMRDHANRLAVFRTVVVLIDPRGDERCFAGHVRGALRREPTVEPQPKMPFSPLFVPEGYTKSWAEMSVEEENKISHRGQAFRAVREYLESLGECAP
ncbi:MAG: non-canonical purine NTP pyrophosphatase [Candidatus Pacebacteria bacterium]|nr:non-canonical purine NTP pyrophosphatase [Candidatus Paceibacterota bacterium]